ncbi:MAG: hypothetical protein HKP13_02385 [Gammaproteobacteria bacterium]|nr:hypothetical protein [Gammaproteobacteria bacterium]
MKEKAPHSMFILRDILTPLQATFSDNKLGRERAHWFALTLLSVIMPFTSSMTSNLLRSLQALFGLALTRRRFYTFMASPTLPWSRLWLSLWDLIPAPLTDGRLVLLLDDSINPKVGRKIFGCESIFDHAAKANQSKYPWAQNVVAVGLLKSIKGRCRWRFGFISRTKPLRRKRATSKKAVKWCLFKPDQY